MQVQEDFTIILTSNSLYWKYSNLSIFKNSADPVKNMIHLQQNGEGPIVYSPDDVMEYIYKRTRQKVLLLLTDYIKEQNLDVTKCRMSQPTKSELEESFEMLQSMPKYEILLEPKRKRSKIILDILHSLKEDKPLKYKEISQNFSDYLNKSTHSKTLEELYDDTIQVKKFSKNVPNKIIAVTKSDVDDKVQMILETIGDMIRNKMDLGSLLDPSRWYYMIFYPENEELTLHLENIAFLNSLNMKEYDFMRVDDQGDVEMEVIKHAMKNAPKKPNLLELQVLAANKQKLENELNQQEVKKYEIYKEITESVKSVKKLQNVIQLPIADVFGWLKEMELINFATLK